MTNQFRRGWTTRAYVPNSGRPGTTNGDFGSVLGYPLQAEHWQAAMQSCGEDEVAAERLLRSRGQHRPMFEFTEFFRRERRKRRDLARFREGRLREWRRVNIKRATTTDPALIGGTKYGRPKLVVSNAEAATTPLHWEPRLGCTLDALAARPAVGLFTGRAGVELQRLVSGESHIERGGFSWKRAAELPKTPRGSFDLKLRASQLRDE